MIKPRGNRPCIGRPIRKCQFVSMNQSLRGKGGPREIPCRNFAWRSSQSEPLRRRDARLVTRDWSDDERWKDAGPRRYGNRRTCSETRTARGHKVFRRPALPDETDSGWKIVQAK